MSEKWWLQTYTGKKFFPLQPDAKALDIRDIARALSNLCRYVGHVDRFYSVAEHCVRVSREVGRRLVIDQGLFESDPWVLNCMRWGLIHDATEAYLSDIARPVKVQPEFAMYRQKEHELQSLLASWCGLTPQEPQIVTEVDTYILGTEARQLKTPVHPDWAATTRTGELPPELPGLTLGWPPLKAEAIYLKRYAKLFTERQ